MYKLIKLEFSNCINNIRFKIMFSILLSISIINFLMTCIQNFGNTSNSVNVFYLMGMLQGTSFRSMFFFFIVTMPIIVSLIYSDSYYTDRKNGIYTSIYMRVGRREYIVAKLIVVALMSFICVFLTLFINEFLIFITFNNKGSYMQGIKVYEYKDRYIDTEFLSYINVYNPIIFKLILIFINSLYALLISMFTYSLSLVLKVKSISIIALVSIGVYLWDILIFKLGLGMKFSMIMYQQGGSGNLLSLLILIVSWIILISIIFVIGIKKDII